jgi:two-component system, NarL family, response regulator DevR
MQLQMMTAKTILEMIEKNVVRQIFSPLSFGNDSASKKEERRPAAPVEQNKNLLRVFLADDSEPIVKRLVALLAAVEGVQIIGSARTVNAAIRGIQHLSPDLAILDFQLPDGTGLDILKKIKQQPFPPIVMMLTNVSLPHYREKCMQCGADYFFDKSQDFDRVVETCRLLLDGISKESKAEEE